jgi:hypothetical protein
MVRAHTSGYIIAGGFAKDGSDGAPWLLKFGEDGETKWEQILVDGYLSSITRTRDGGYVGGGHDPGRQSGSLVKFDRGGNLQWITLFEDQDIRVVETINETSPGVYVIGGGTGSDDSNRGFVQKTNRDRDAIWRMEHTQSVTDVSLRTSDVYFVTGFQGDDGETPWVASVGPASTPTPTASPTPTPTPEPSTLSPAKDTPEISAPGFGIVGSLAALGLGYLLQRDRDE